MTKEGATMKLTKKEREDRKAVWSSWKLENMPRKGLSIRN